MDVGVRNCIEVVNLKRDITMGCTSTMQSALGIEAGCRAGVGGGQAPCTRGNRCQWGEWISVSFNMQKGTEYM